MPEGPELLRSRDQLRKLVVGKRFVSFVSTGGRYRNEPPVGLSDFQSALDSAEVKVEGVNVKGKFMYWTLTPQVPFIGKEDVWYLWCTYGMSGQWTTNPIGKHTAAAATFSAPELTLTFEDQRHFGTLKFVQGHSALQKKLNTLGPDMLSNPPALDEFKERLMRRGHLTIAEALMNQSIVSGVGNYVKAEALHRAKLSPNRIVSAVSSDELSTLRTATIDVMRLAYNGGGATIQTYRSPDGAAGNAQNFFQVYSRKHDALGHVVIREETQDGRTTHWCPQCQT